MELVGRVLHVNVSQGGLPKLPLERAWVSRLGLDGDGHNEATAHGGPHRAVCLFAIEAIERLQAEGHPVEPGGVGENLTTSGVEWSLLPIGTRARIGHDLELELAGPAAPCTTQGPNFLGRRFSRISIVLHPSDSRMYARVLREGEVRPGDRIELLPPSPDSRARAELLLARLDRAEAKSSLAGWQAARGAGFDVRIVDDGELAMVATPEVPGPAFNKAMGLARMPNLLPLATAFFDRHQCPGWLTTEKAPWPGSTPELVLGIFAAAPSVVPQQGLPEGLTIRRLGGDETSAWDQVHDAASSGGLEPGARNPWPAVSASLAELPRWTFLLAQLDGRPVGAGLVFVSGRTGWLRAGAVVPDARGRGIQRALIGARARLAAVAGCDLLGASAVVGSISARNLERMGFEQIGVRENHKYLPAGAPS